MDFYGIFSDFYDILDVTYFADREKSPRTAVKRLTTKEKFRALDMCCGTFGDMIPTAKAHPKARFTGIDRSAQMLRNARKSLIRNGVHNVTLRRMDATDTKLMPESFDYIFLSLALHEQEPSLQDSILKEARRLLKPSGRLIVTEWEEPQKLPQRLLFFPLRLLEQFLCRSFLDFYRCGKKEFFESRGFRLEKTVHCSYSAVYVLKK